MSVSFDFGFAPGLPAPAAKWSGFPKYNFIGGHNDAEQVPVAQLVAAATAVLTREGSSLATYGLNSGPLGYRPLREFLAGKLKWHAGISCAPDEILITSGSLQGLDLVNSLLLVPGDTVLVEEDCYSGSLSRLSRRGVQALACPSILGGCASMCLPRCSPTSNVAASARSTSTRSQPCKIRAARS